MSETYSWATEDPNPKAKVYEYERLVELGKKGIGSKLTPEFIDAVRRMDELEGLVEPQGYDPEDVRAIEGSNKRAAIEGPSTNGGAEDSGEAQQSNKKTKTDAPAAQAKGILSGSALDSLKKAAALRKLKQQKAASSTASPTAATAAK